MEIMSRVSAHAGHNCDVCLSAHRRYKINAIHLLLGLLDSPLAFPFVLKLLDT